MYRRHVHPLLGLVLALICIAGPPTLLVHSATSLQSSAPPAINRNPEKVVNVIVVGATGDLAAKYLWVALFRLALEGKSTSGRSFRFFAGASDTLERGRIWREQFFDDVFAERVCGVLEGEQEQISTAQLNCREFLDTDFKPNVQYAPLRTERHYRDLGKTLIEISEQLSTISEVGRIVYLAIPPQFFLQSCDFIHRYLRPQPTKTGFGDPFIRVVVEKPFGRDLQSAHELATRLRAIYSLDELYVMDHYAGKAVVRALRSYFQLNAARLHPVWNAKHIQDIYIEMTEKATLQNRVHYFDSVGIIRDIMVNHLQLLLGVVVAPSFDPEIYAARSSSTEFSRRVHKSQLRFIDALKSPEAQEALFVAQYDEYAAHYEADMEKTLDESDHFTPTAALIELTSSIDEWRNTTFHLAAAKATAVRRLAITVTFRDGVFPNTEAHPCTFTVIIQGELNADTHHSQTIEWSCDVDKVVGDLQLPDGWEYLVADDYRAITPTKVKKNLQGHGTEAVAWELGDEPSAYDTLLQEVANGATEHFADFDEIEAAWTMWTPIVNAAELLTHQPVHESKHLQTQTPQDGPLKHATYPAGTFPWEQLRSKSSFSSAPKEEL